MSCLRLLLFELASIRSKFNDELFGNIKPDVFEFFPFAIFSRVQPLPIPAVDRLRTWRPAASAQNLNKSCKQFFSDFSLL